MQRQPLTKSVLTSLLMKEFKDKTGTTEEIDEFLSKHDILICNDRQTIDCLMADTADEDLEQVDLMCLYEMVKRRPELVKEMLDGKTVKTKKSCLMDYKGIEHIS